ncbi:hypothetical protein VTJ04DRAFT_9654 [Mycothermus thermophilus]|uniref:uncharacterized protein n=1 Tax=Humicola insolens TaxID=85995 RepID=UPI0037423DB4
MTSSDTSQPPIPGLLRLPPNVRQRIYHHLGITPFYDPTILFFLRPPCSKDIFHPEYWTVPPPWHDFSGLFLTCRALHDEVAARFYATYRFAVFYASPGDLAPLRHLTPAAAAALTQVKVVLREASCHKASRLIEHAGFCCLKGVAGEALGYKHCGQCRHSGAVFDGAAAVDGQGEEEEKSRVEAMIKEWEEVAQHLAANVPAGRLDLALVCDINPRHERASDVAQRVLAPLAQFPKLRDCHIRLGRDRDERLWRLARDTALQVQGLSVVPQPDSQPARAWAGFLDLPRELRVAILRQTDLVTPWEEVAWSRMTRRFQVCRLYVFFSSNRFVVHDFSSVYSWLLPEQQTEDFDENDDEEDERRLIPESDREPFVPGYPFERLAVSEFLRQAVPEHCLGDLRFLEMVFPPYAPGCWPSAHDPAIRDWRETVEWAHSRIDPSGLTVRFVTREIRKRCEREVRGEEQAVHLRHSTEPREGAWKLIFRRLGIWYARSERRIFW